MNGQGEQDWEAICNTQLDFNVTYNTYVDGETGRAVACFNGTFLLAKGVTRWNERLMVGFACDRVTTAHLGGNDVIITYALFEGADPQP